MADQHDLPTLLRGVLDDRRTELIDAQRKVIAEAADEIERLREALQGVLDAGGNYADLAFAADNARKVLAGG